MSELDWGALQQEAKSAAALPDGEYNAFVLDTEATKSSNGKPMIRVRFRIVDGPAKDRAVRTQFVISPESPVALRIFFQHMETIGLGADFFASNPPLANVAGQLKGKYVTLILGTRPWQGNDVNEVKGYKPYAGATTANPLAGASVNTTPSPLSAPPSPLTAPPAPAPVATPVMNAPPAPGSPPPAEPF